jgi:hypothetical protein
MWVKDAGQRRGLETPTRVSGLWFLAGGWERLPSTRRQGCRRILLSLTTATAAVDRSNVLFIAIDDWRNVKRTDPVERDSVTRLVRRCHRRKATPFLWS